MILYNETSYILSLNKRLLHCYISIGMWHKLIDEPQLNTKFVFLPMPRFKTHEITKIVLNLFKDGISFSNELLHHVWKRWWKCCWKNRFAFINMIYICTNIWKKWMLNGANYYKHTISFWYKSVSSCYKIDFSQTYS